jgi:hypothetical protein
MTVSLCSRRPLRPAHQWNQAATRRISFQFYPLYNRLFLDAEWSKPAGSSGEIITFAIVRGDSAHSQRIWDALVYLSKDRRWGLAKYLYRGRRSGWQLALLHHGVTILTWDEFQLDQLVAIIAEPADVSALGETLRLKALYGDDNRVP